MENQIPVISAGDLGNLDFTGKRVLIVAKRDAGKTTLAFDIMNQVNNSVNMYVNHQVPKSENAMSITHYYERIDDYVFDRIQSPSDQEQEYSETHIFDDCVALSSSLNSFNAILTNLKGKTVITTVQFLHPKLLHDDEQKPIYDYILCTHEDVNISLQKNGELIQQCYKINVHLVTHKIKSLNKYEFAVFDKSYNSSYITSFESLDMSNQNSANTILLFHQDRNTKLLEGIIKKLDDDKHFEDVILIDQYESDKLKYPFVDAIYDTKEDIIDKVLKIATQYTHNKQQKNILIIINNCFRNLYKHYAMSLRHLIMNGRHYHISIIINENYLLDVAPEIRCNMDYIFISNKITTKSQKQSIYNQYCGMFSNYSLFDTFYNVAANINDVPTYIMIRNHNLNSKNIIAIVKFDSDIELNKQYKSPEILKQTKELKNDQTDNDQTDNDEVNNIKIQMKHLLSHIKKLDRKMDTLLKMTEKQKSRKWYEDSDSESENEI